ncbi:MAG: asparagine synthase (glutamine-hydrolyzing) [Polyangiaceae bacterium]
MCGLFAITSRRPIERERVSRGLDALQHRGPDGQGIYVSRDQQVALGHRRLAILDREGGAQPLFNEDQSVVAMVNGELYEHLDLRRDLEERGHRFTTGTDSELIVHLYEEYGADLVHRLRGEFAFVLYDTRDRTLLAARDRFGIKPLVLYRDQHELLIASEAKALFAAGVRPSWDLGSVFQSVCLQYPLENRTLFAGVEQIPAGYLLRVVDGSVSMTRYWDMNHPPALDSNEPSEREVHERVIEIRQSLEQAVVTRLRADVPVAFQLSGGIDSSAVLALAAPHVGKAHAFTVSFDAQSHDEMHIARETALHCGAELHIVEGTTASLVDVLEAAIGHGEGIAINAHIAAKWMLSRAIRAAGFAVVLTGEGSDEVLAGYPHLRRDLALAEPVHSSAASTSLTRLQSSNQASAGVMMPHGHTLSTDAIRHRLGFVPSWIEAKASLGWRVAPLLASDFMAERASRDAYRVFLDSMPVHEQLQGRTLVDQSLYLWNKTALAGYILKTLGDGMEMAHSIEGRLPFLDHMFFERARALPLSLKIRDGVEKWRCERR